MDKRKTNRPKRERIEQMDPTYRTGMLDGYAKAIQKMNQSRRDRILERIIKA